MLELPDWYVGGRTDTEDALCDYFDWLTERKVFTCTWLPVGHYTPTEDEVGGTEPTLRIWRQPGKFDDSTRTDVALYQIAAITQKRSWSIELSEFVRQMLDDEVFSSLPIPRKDGSVTKFKCAEEWMGPQIIPERYVDDKFIPVTFKLPIREPRGLPKYREILTQLPKP